MDLSVLLAGILGPVLIILSSSEYLNFNIWKDVHPTVVYLNGLLLLILGLVIVSIHNVWVLSWQVIITLTGWSLILAGSFRMFFPTARQASLTMAVRLVLMAFFLIGLILTWRVIIA